MKVNIERGVRRLILVLSLLVGFGTAAVSASSLLDRWERDRRSHLQNEQTYENIKLFWRVWDANCWDTGQRETLRALLADHGMKFTSDGGTFTLYQDDVLPGIDGTINLPPGRGLEGLPPAVVAAIQKAREQGLWDALWRGAETDTFWTRRPPSQLLGASIFFGLLLGTVPFTVVWLSFFVFRWIACGFAGGKAPAQRGAGSGEGANP